MYFMLSWMDGGPPRLDPLPPSDLSAAFIRVLRTARAIQHVYLFKLQGETLQQIYPETGAVVVSSTLISKE